jgi:hypothetical protein
MMAHVSHRNENGKTGDNDRTGTDKIRDLSDRGAKAGERMLDITREQTEQARATGTHVMAETRTAMGHGLDAAADTVRKAGERTGSIARQAQAEEADVANAWLTLGRDQLEHNVETFKRMAAIRDMRELAELQQEYVRVSLSRVTQLVLRQTVAAGRLFASGRQAADRQT